MKPLFFLSFLRRYWKLLLFLSGLEIIRHVDIITYAWGPMFFLIELSVASIAATLLLRNLFMRDTLDSYVQKRNGEPSLFHEEWDSVPPTLRVILSIAVMCSFFVGICLIAASLAK